MELRHHLFINIIGERHNGVDAFVRLVVGHHRLLVHSTITSLASVLIGSEPLDSLLERLHRGGVEGLELVLVEAVVLAKSVL